jgi:hypothetical protein
MSKDLNADVTEDEMIGLSDEEKAALSDDDETGDTDTDDGHDDDHDDGANDDHDDGDSSDSDADADSKPKGDKGGDAASDTGADDDADSEKEFQAQYKAEAVDDYDGKVSSIAEKKEDLLGRFQDGEIDIGQYQKERDTIDQELRAIDKAQLKHEMSVEQSNQSAEQRWTWEQDRFFENDSNKIYKENPIISAALDTAIKNLAEKAKTDSAIASKPMGWFLKEADRQVRSIMNLGTTGKGKTNRRADLSNLPPNLGDYASSDLSDNFSKTDEFSALDKLGGMELEAALARLSPAEQDRYLKA